MPAIHGGVELHAGIAAAPSGVGNLVEQFFGFVSLHRPAIFDGAGGELGVAEDGVHKVVSHADRVVGVLEEDG